MNEAEELIQRAIDLAKEAEKEYDESHVIVHVRKQFFQQALKQILRKRQIRSFLCFLIKLIPVFTTNI